MSIYHEFLFQDNLKKSKFSLHMSGRSTIGTVECRVYLWYYRKKVDKNSWRTFRRYARVRVLTKGKLKNILRIILDLCFKGVLRKLSKSKYNGIQKVNIAKHIFVLNTTEQFFIWMKTFFVFNPQKGGILPIIGS